MNIEKKVREGEEASSTPVLRMLMDFLTNEHRNKERKLKDLKERFRGIKKQAMENREKLVEEAMASLRDNGCDVYYADSKEDVAPIVKNLISKEDVVVKSKSNTMKELKLVDKLSNEGIDVIETDFGDRIIQLSGENPGHPVGPAIHVPVEKVAEVFSKESDVNIEPDPESIVREGVKGMMERFENATVGLTGANAVAAREGSLTLIENEGNISLATRLPKRHIAIVGTDKVLPTMEDALFQTLVSEKFVGTEGTYISHIKGPSRTRDIAAQEVIGVYGAREVHVIFVDHWRSEAVEKGYKDMLKCVNCGSCLYPCPVIYSIGLEFGEIYPGGSGIFKSMAVDGIEKAAERGAWLCLTCGACQHFCPSGIDIPKTIQKVREKCIENSLIPEKVREFLENTRRLGNPYGQPRKDRNRWTEKSEVEEFNDHAYLLYVGCVGCYDTRTQKTAKALVKLLNSAGVSFGILGKEETCAGNSVKQLGEKGLFEQLAEKNVKKFNEKGVKKIITLSPHAYNAFKNEYPKHGGDFEVSHYTQLLKELKESGKINIKEKNVKVTYHDPCYLGRHNNLFETPREVLRSIPGLELVEMENNKEYARCCGGGGGNFYMDYLGGCDYSPSKVRVREAGETGADILTTACPTCVTMLDEAAEAENKGIGIDVKDISELISERI